MSRGLGVLQRRIMDTLDEAKAAALRYRGADYVYGEPGHYAWMRLDDRLIKLPPGVYDLRCSAAYLARMDGYIYGAGHHETSFTACFSRAAHALVRRDLLVRLCRIPIGAVWEGIRQGVHVLTEVEQECTVFHWPSSQLRFVTVSANPSRIALRLDEAFRRQCVS